MSLAAITVSFGISSCRERVLPRESIEMFIQLYLPWGVAKNTTLLYIVGYKTLLAAWG
jgi:hypothetical protein